MGFGDAINKGKEALGDQNVNEQIDKAQEQHGDKVPDQVNQGIDAAQKKFGNQGGDNN